MFLDIVLKAEENLLYALTKRHELYEQNLENIYKLSAHDSWDRTTQSLCVILLIGSLFSKGGLNKKELLRYLGKKSYTTLNSKLDVLKGYNLVTEQKEGNNIYYKLSYDNLVTGLRSKSGDTNFPRVACFFLVHHHLIESSANFKKLRMIFEI